MFKYYLMLIGGVSFFFGMSLWLKNAYSYTSLWCWTTSYHLKFMLFYSFVMGTAVFIGYVHLRVSRVIRRDFKSLINKSYKKDLVHINNKVTQVLIIFLITHFFGLLNRSVEGGTGETNIGTGVMQVCQSVCAYTRQRSFCQEKLTHHAHLCSLTYIFILQALLMPLRGFLNSLVYGLRGRKPPLFCLLLARRFPLIGKCFFFQ